MIAERKQDQVARMSLEFGAKNTYFGLIAISLAIAAFVISTNLPVLVKIVEEIIIFIVVAIILYLYKGKMKEIEKIFEGP